MAYNLARRQRGTIYDLIAQGEIEGIVGGYSGIYYNGTALVDAEQSGAIAPKYGTGTVANSNGVAQITNYSKLQIRKFDCSISLPIAYRRISPFSF